MLIFSIHYLNTIYFEDWNTYTIKSDTEEKRKAVSNEDKLERENEEGRMNVFLYAVQCHLYSFNKGRLRNQAEMRSILLQFMNKV